MSESQPSPPFSAAAADEEPGSVFCASSIRRWKHSRVSSKSDADTASHGAAADPAAPHARNSAGAPPALTVFSVSPSSPATCAMGLAASSLPCTHIAPISSPSSGASPSRRFVCTRPPMRSRASSTVRLSSPRGRTR